MEQFVMDNASQLITAVTAVGATLLGGWMGSRTSKAQRRHDLANMESDIYAGFLSAVMDVMIATEKVGSSLNAEQNPALREILGDPKVVFDNSARALAAAHALQARVALIDDPGMQECLHDVSVRLFEYRDAVVTLSSNEDDAETKREALASANGAFSVAAARRLKSLRGN